jgi:multidrug efflux pump subunit AcrB
VVVLVLITLGRREAGVVGAAIVATLAITLFASWAWGFTLNRVSLFALIFSIGILVDDAIVVVENIHRHMQLGARSLTEAIPRAVDEVGGPTILATFTVIAALLPMAFVTGLMGPYMRPIPINASTGMLISLAVAFMFTRGCIVASSPMCRVHHAPADAEDRLHKLIQRLMTPFLRERQGTAYRWGLLAVLLVLILGSVALVGFGAVVMKMLPFDNKSEFQVMVDMPEGTPLEDTHRVLQALADHLETVPEVQDYQLYAGTSAPINFNGLVRQYYLRESASSGRHSGEPGGQSLRSRKSHDIALAVRGNLAEIGRRHGANVTMVEVPPDRRCGHRWWPRSTDSTTNVRWRWPARCGLPSKPLPTWWTWTTASRRPSASWW